MSEDRSEQPKGWFGKLTQAFSDEPRSREDLLSDLRQASDENLLDSEALTIMEKHRISSLIVTSDSGHLLGVVTLLSVLKAGIS